MIQLAQNIDQVIGRITPPAPVRRIGFGSCGISSFLTTLTNLAFVIAGVICLFLIIWGAFQYILSGGDKEAAGAARKRITYAILGLVLLSLSFFMARVVGDITGFKLVGGPLCSIPGP